MAPQPPSSNEPELNTTLATPFVTSETAFGGTTCGVGVIQMAVKFDGLRFVASTTLPLSQSTFGVAVGKMLGNA